VTRHRKVFNSLFVQGNRWTRDIYARRCGHPGLIWTETATMTSWAEFCVFKLTAQSMEQVHYKISKIKWIHGFGSRLYRHISKIHLRMHIKQNNRQYNSGGKEYHDLIVHR
jgi:hypothetical protein